MDARERREREAMNQDQIWILSGTRGAYSDRRDWIVRAYRTEEAAEAAAAEANAAILEAARQGRARPYYRGEGIDPDVARRAEASDPSSVRETTLVGARAPIWVYCYGDDAAYSVEVVDLV